MFARSATAFVLLAMTNTLVAASATVATALRQAREVAGADLRREPTSTGVDEDEIHKDEARVLAPCPPVTFLCAPSVHLATQAQATAAGGAESNYYAALGSSGGTQICHTTLSTVMQLAGVTSCSSQIASVPIQLYYKGRRIRGFTEKISPYTVFGDDTKDKFNSKVLGVGDYSLTVTIRDSQSCPLWTTAISFDVVDCTDPPTPPPSPPPTPVGPTPVPTDPPTEFPTEPPSPAPSPVPTEGEPTPFPTEPPTEPPTDPPTLYPTPPPTECGIPGPYRRRRGEWGCGGGFADFPTEYPTVSPTTIDPTPGATASPTTANPTDVISAAPTLSPTLPPTEG